MQEKGGDMLIVITVVPEPLEGVHLFLGYSRKDAKVLMEGRQKVSDMVAATEEEEQEEVLSTVQQAVSYFTSNNNKVSLVLDRSMMILVLQSDCTIGLVEKSGENYVLTATLDEWLSFRRVPGNEGNYSNCIKHSE